MDPTTIPAADVAERLGTDPDAGLTAAEAAQRLASHGPNALVRHAARPWWRKVLHQFADPLVYLLLVAVAVSVVAWFAEGAEGLPVDAIVIIAVLVLNAGIGLAQERRAEDAVAALARLTAATATVVRDGRLEQVPATDLVPGDLLHLSEGDAVGARWGQTVGDRAPRVAPCTTRSWIPGMIPTQRATWTGPPSTAAPRRERRTNGGPGRLCSRPTHHRKTDTHTHGRRHRRSRST